MPERQTDGDFDRSLDAAEAMPTQGRALAAPVLRFDLRTELVRLRRQPGYEAGKPTGTTLVKEPDLRIVLMALKAGGRLEEHRASGPISLQGIEGSLRLRLPDATAGLAAGELLVLEPGIRHDVEAVEDAAFLLTIGRTTYEHVSDRHEPRAR